jgi:hypothetical protein
VLPLLLFGIFTGLQMIRYCHNLVHLQRMAAVAADRMTIEGAHNRQTHHWIVSLWGRIFPPKRSLERDTQLRWVPATARAKTYDRGAYVTVREEITLLSGWGILRRLPWARQTGTAQMLLEAPVPKRRR